MSLLIPTLLTHSATGHTGRLLRSLLCLSLLFLVAHLAFQICLHTMPQLNQLLGQNCKWWGWKQLAEAGHLRTEVLG